MKIVVDDLIGQFQRTFQTPVKVAMLIVDCLDYYFSGKTGDEYQWGYRFGGGWWELPDEKMPGKSDVLAYSHEVEMRILDQLSTLEDSDLLKPAEIQDGAAETALGRLVYALRHTLHHQGELSALAVYYGLPGGSWA